MNNTGNEVRKFVRSCFHAIFLDELEDQKIIDPETPLEKRLSFIKDYIGNDYLIKKYGIQIKDVNGELGIVPCDSQHTLFKPISNPPL